MSQLSAQSPVRFCWTPIESAGITARLAASVTSLAVSARRRAPGFERRRALRDSSSNEFTADQRRFALPAKLITPPAAAKARPL